MGRRLRSSAACTPCLLVLLLASACQIGYDRVGLQIQDGSSEDAAVPPTDGSTPDASTPDASTPDGSIPEGGIPDAATDGGPSFDGGLPDGCTAADVNGSLHVICHLASTRDPAAAACASWGLSLATIHSAAHNSAISALGQSGREYWIGLNDRDVEGVFIWDATGTESPTYRSWFNQPTTSATRNCVATFSPQGSWTDYVCGVGRDGFVCN